MRRVVVHVLFILIVMCPIVTVGAEDGPDARVTAMETRLRLRAMPSSRGEVLGFLDPGTALGVLGRTADRAWLQVRTPDRVSGWVVSDFVEVYVDLADVPVTTNLGALWHEPALAGTVAQTVRETYALGETLGNLPGMFSKVGDSLTAAPHMLYPIGEGLYDLGDYQHLQSVIDRFSGDEEDNPFSRESLAAGIGWSTAVVLDARFADPEQCEADETPLACEYRSARPSVALIMLGTNDVSILTADTYEINLRVIVRYSLDVGVIPVISTIPVRQGFEAESEAFNAIVRETAERYHIPLWDFGAAVEDLPNGGRDEDGIHLSIPPGGYKGSARFNPYNLEYGYVLRNLTALQVLDAVMVTVEETADQS